MKHLLDFYSAFVKPRSNVLLSAFEAIYNGGIQFFLYILVSNSLGAASLGVWAIVVSLSATARIGDFGLQSAISRHVAVEAALPNGGDTRNIVWSGLALAVVAYSVLAFAAWVPLSWVLKGTLSGDELRSGTELLPWTLALFAVNNISQSAMASLVGLGRLDLKSKYLIIGETIQLPISYIFVGTIGLAGVAVAQLIQFCIAFSLSVIFLLRCSPPSKPTLRTSILLLKFGAKVQIASFAQLAFETLFKITLGKLLGMSALGTFELANRFVMQIRNIIAAPAQSLIAKFAGKNPQLSLPKSTKWYGIWAVVAFSICISASPLVHHFVSDSIDKSLFMPMIFTTSVMWSINIASIPSYVFGISTGNIKWNIIGHLTSIFLLLPVFFFRADASGFVISTVIVSSCRVFGDLVPTFRFFFLDRFISRNKSISD